MIRGAHNHTANLQTKRVSLNLKGKWREMIRQVALALLVTSTLPGFAGEADVVEVDIFCNSESVCRFDVTVRHDDEGWEHFANRWEILSPDGEILATRELAHPHDDEQPFTRSLGNVKVPPGLSEVVVRAHDLVHGYGGRELTVQCPVADIAQ